MDLCNSCLPAPYNINSHFFSKNHIKTKELPTEERFNECLRGKFMGYIQSKLDNIKENPDLTIEQKQLRLILDKLKGN